ncbi:MAG: hypothetical protein JWO54_89 [Candidatus Saccharibacteria bacterium]|nr:hypothetical protein [Candidatus Saccharibacteria bacterium]
MKRAGFNSLRAARIGVPLFAIVSMSLFFSLLHSQPANAEGFLDRTLRCTVGALFGSQCPPSTPEQVITSTQPVASQPAPSQSPSSNAGSTQPAQSQTIVGRQPSAVQPLQMAPLSVELTRVQELPIFPSTMNQSSIPAWVTFATNYGQVKGTFDLGDSALQPSGEGWRIFGISWYWWVAVTLVTAILGRWAMKRRQLLISIAK